MVHYDPDVSAAPATPLLCPICGSHRTEVVGKSLNDAVIVIRCNACGERSQIANPRTEHATVNLAEIASLMKASVIGGDFRRRVRGRRARNRSVQA